MSRFSPSWYWQSIVDGPVAALTFDEFLANASARERIEFVMARLSRFETLFDPIEKDLTTCIKGKRAVELKDAGVLQLLEILHRALYDKHGVKCHEVYRRYTMSFFRKLPDVVLDTESSRSEPSFLPAYPETRQSIVRGVMNMEFIGEAPTSRSRDLFRFLIAAYVGQGPKQGEKRFQGRQTAREDLRKFIEGLIRDQVARIEKSEDMLHWTQEPNLPRKIREIFLIALLKKTDLGRAEIALRSLIIAS